jgi:hypothetical protein
MSRNIRLAATLFALLQVGRLPAAPALADIPPALGPHVNLKPGDFTGAKSFRHADRIVGTYYFTGMMPRRRLTSWTATAPTRSRLIRPRSMG